MSGVLEDVQTTSVSLFSWAYWEDQGCKVYSSPNPSHHAFASVCAKSVLVNLRRYLLWSALLVAQLASLIVDYTSGTLG